MSIEEDKRSLIERKRNLLYLIAQYLDDYGLTNTHETLFKEANLQTTYEICDNIDLDTIYLDYCSYYQLKFNRLPKICKKSIDENQLIITNNNNNNNGRKSANIKRKKFQNANLSSDNNQNATKSGELALSSSIIVSSLQNNNNNNVDANYIHNTVDGKQQHEQEKKIKPFEFLQDEEGNCKRTQMELIRPLRDYEYCTPEWKDMAQSICRDVIKKKYPIKWQQIYGHDDIKGILEDGVILPIKYPELFINGGIRPWKAILLHGPPGTGKTLLAKALCTETYGKVTFFNVSSSTIISKWRGDSEKYIRVLFDLAKFYAPSVIFIDEIDGLTSRRDVPSEHEASKRFKNDFLIQIDQLDDLPDGCVIMLLANTNLPWEIDMAFLRRFERKLLIGIPNRLDRIRIIREYLPIAMKWNDGVLTELSEMCDGFTGDDIRVASKDATMKRIRQAVACTNNNGNAFGDGKNHRLKSTVATTMDIGEVTVMDFQLSIKKIQPTANKLLIKHQEWFNKYGNQIEL